MRTAASILVVVLTASPMFAQRGERAKLPDGAAVADFGRRVQDYVELRSRVERGEAKLDDTPNAEDIVKAEKALAEKIRHERTASRRGNIFTPDIERRFRALLNPELRGTTGQNNRGIIWDEGPGPGAFTPRVNAAYPKEQPLSTVPPSILETLPPLPEGIEYRFVGRHLILRDARANLIIDFMLNAIAGGG